MTTRQKRESGVTLVELMISMLVLSLGLGALTTLFAGSIATNNRNSRDTTATMLAQKVIEELTAQNTNSTSTLTVTDCAGNTWTIPSTQGLPFASGGQGATLVTDPSSFYYGGIDFNQSYGSVPAGFAMQYVDCGTNGTQTTYDVRWNVMTITANNTRLITASARRKVSTGTANALYFAIPVTLRSIGGSGT